MANITREGNRIIFELTDASAFQCFRTGLKDKRRWASHADTRELAKYVNETGMQNVVVKWGTNYHLLKKLM